jgi:calcineurin-like phosphoesterase family protein
MPKIVFISDTHNKHKQLTIPECDILIHTGDWSGRGQKSETENFAKWLDEQPATEIIVVPGNHEVTFQNCLESEEGSSRKWITDHCPRAHVLIHEAKEIAGIKFFGSPYTPAFGFGWAWNAARTVKEASYIYKPFIGDLWAYIPLDTQILLTHGPGYGTLDTVTGEYNNGLTSVGCVELSNKIKELKDLKIHSFGHLHADGGTILVKDNVTYVNAAVLDDSYRKPLSRDIVVIDYNKE